MSPIRALRTMSLVAQAVSPVHPALVGIRTHSNPGALSRPCQNLLNNLLVSPRSDHNLRHSPPQGVSRSVQLCLHTPVSSAFRNQPVTILRCKFRNHATGTIAYTIDISEEQKRLGAEACSARHRHLVGIHVVNPPRAVPRNARHHWQIAISGQNLQQPCVRSHSPPHRPKLGTHLFGLREHRVYSRKAYSRSPSGNKRSHELLIHCPRKNLQNCVQHIGRGDPKSIDEMTLDPPFCQEARHLFAAAVHHHDLMTSSRDLVDFCSQAASRRFAVEQRPAQFDEKLHNRPSVSGNPSARFMFCTACPAAPFPRLSIVQTTTARPVAPSRRTPISQ